MVTSEPGHRNILGDSIEKLPEAEVNDVHCFPLIHKSIHFYTVGNQVGWARSDLGRIWQYLGTWHGMVGKLTL